MPRASFAAPSGFGRNFFGKDRPSGSSIRSFAEMKVAIIARESYDRSLRHYFFQTNAYEFLSETRRDTRVANDNALMVSFKRVTTRDR